MTSLNKNQFRAIAYYEFLRGQSAAKTADSINEAFKEEVLSHSTVVRLFQRFKSGDISFENHPSSGRPPIQNDDALIDAVEKNPSATTRELAMKLGVSQSTITRQLHSLGYRKVMSSWIPPGSNSSSHLASRVSVCQSLLSRPNRKDLISQIVTGSEFSIFYVNHIGQKKWNSREEPPTKQSKQECSCGKEYSRENQITWMGCSSISFSFS
uniref:HTH_48 domain-containing protein n=1 Tax=Caenorhabditis tropicalis TaxID=1561998 RepID=A0A1I7TM94_9PELO